MTQIIGKQLGNLRNVIRGGEKLISHPNESVEGYL